MIVKVKRTFLVCGFERPPLDKITALRRIAVLSFCFLRSGHCERLKGEATEKKERVKKTERVKLRKSNNKLQDCYFQEQIITILLAQYTLILQMFSPLSCITVLHAPVLNFHCISPNHNGDKEWNKYCPLKTISCYHN